MSRRIQNQHCTMADARRGGKWSIFLGNCKIPCALDTLKTIMTEDDPYLVLEAVKAAGKIRGPKAMECLLIMMHHQSFMERGEVAVARDESDHPNRD